MSNNSNRCGVIQSLIIGLLCLSTLLSCSAADENEIQIIEITQDIVLLVGGGGNVVIHEGPDSILMIDGGSAEYSHSLLSVMSDKYRNKPVSALVNTHWHLEQTGLNDHLGAEGVPIFAHINTLGWMKTRIEQEWNGRIFEPRTENALPTDTFFINETIDHGYETIILAHTPRAHTDGDIHVLFPKSNVIVAGGIAYRGSYPILDTATNGWIGEMLDATRTLLNISDESTIIIPSDGMPLKRSDLLAQEEMLATILQRFKEHSSKGLGADDMLRAGFVNEYIENWGDPDEFVYSAWDGLWDHMRGLGAF